MLTNKMPADSLFPLITAVDVNSGEMQTLTKQTSKWQLLVVYRGKHCGRCKKYLNGLQAMLPEWQAAGFDVMVVSADSREKALQDQQEFGWQFPLACELSIESMQRLGLYISEPLSPDEADGPFAEPALFCLRPDGKVQMVAISNGPSARPDLAELLDGMIFNIEKQRPARGTHCY
ncbi:redoxin domain-containing protein [Marinomonas epiphytica]